VIFLQNPHNTIMRDFQASENFWRHLQQLVETSDIIIERPKGSVHPNYPGYIHPVDYGYLKNTSGADGSEIDIWAGSSGSERVEAILCIIDLDKRDSEIKILFSCTDDEIERIVDLQNQGNMSALLIRREGTD
jgi:inorganic pyrophosphatase